MSEDKYLKLTNALYKIIEFFPEGEPLKNKTKEKALEVMESLVLVQGNPGNKEKVSAQILEDIEVLKSYLRLGKSQGWIDSVNFLILSKEYDKVKEEIQPAYSVMQRGAGLLIDGIGKQITFEQNNEEQTVDSQDVISERQKKIIEILRKQEKAQVGDLKKVFSNVSKRTLRRDLDDLLKKKKVIRAGEWNQVFYKLKEMGRTKVVS